MKRILLILIIGLGTVTYPTQPLLAAGQETVRKQDRKKESQKKTETVTFKTSIHCKNCIKKVNDNISFEKGVKKIETSLDDKLVTITYDAAKTDETTLARAIEKLGYSAVRIERNQQQ